MHISEPSLLGFVLDKLNASFIPHLSSLNVKVLNRLFTPRPSRRHLILSNGIRARSLLVRLHRLESKDVV